MYAIDDMTIFVRVVERASLSATGPIDSKNTPALIDWALGGAGIVMKSVWDLADEIEAGRLVPILLAHRLRDLAIHVLVPPHWMHPPKSRAFINFIVERLSKLPSAGMAKAFEAETG